MSSEELTLSYKGFLISPYTSISTVFLWFFLCRYTSYTIQFNVKADVEYIRREAKLIEYKKGARHKQKQEKKIPRNPEVRPRALGGSTSPASLLIFIV
jgi:hypothetical protein